MLAAHSSVRAEVVPGRERPAPAQLPLFAASDAGPPPPSRHPWDWLLRRVFAVDVSVCPVPGCDGRMRLVEIATTPVDIARILGAQARAPPPLRPRRPARPGQLSLTFG